MLKKGDVISYGTTGVCKVEGECEQTVKGQKKRYIVLKPVHQINSTLYVPVDNDELKTKFKPLLTGDEIEEIIKEMPEESSLWKESSSERAELYSQVLESGDRKRLAQLVRTLYLRQKHLHWTNVSSRMRKICSLTSFQPSWAYPKTRSSTL